MREIFAVEYRNARGEMTQKKEDYDLTKGRAYELALRYCQEQPDCVAVIYFELEKPNGKDKNGNPKWAAQTVTERVIKGRGYRGPKVFSTMMRQGKIRKEPDVAVAPA
ncbi:hypothetical protein LCGC14_1718820 [marine sediment metagenome]|uniref:Uncharacterized protein n=1 Tax=marine sediment metagenome TaxID=412755 RepID=A0A0F9HDC7_9ZZZZ